jgi:hypothetical protein
MRHRIACLFASSALALSACLGRGQPSATATARPLLTATQPAVAGTATLPSPATAAPGETAAPTQAPAGTATAAGPTPSAVAVKATPAATATPDPNEAVGDVIYQDKLDGKGGWYWTFSDDVANFGVVDGKLQGAMKTANSGWRFTISPDTLQFGSQQARLTTHTVSCGSNDEYGLMLRIKSDASNSGFDGYLFKLRCAGAASFELIYGTSRSTLVDWTSSPAINTGAPADNNLLVWAAGGEFRFYANNHYLFSAHDNILTAGFYGVYLNDRTAGGETVTFDTLVARGVNK